MDWKITMTRHEFEDLKKLFVGYLIVTIMVLFSMWMGLR